VLAELRFDGAPVLVTGGGSGIGRACCEVFAELGATVILLGRRIEPLDETVALLAPFGVETAAYVCDVSDEQQVNRVRDEVAARWPALKALVNNAGANINGDLAKLTFDEWNRVLGSHLSSIFLMTKAYLPLLLAANQPSIVNMSSIAGLVGVKGRPAYSAAKGAVIALTQQLAIEYGGQIRINAISPGTTDKAAGFVRDESWEAVRRNLLTQIPLGRAAQPREIANAIVWMASDAASFLHGANVVIDGGRTIV
jgi:NAD(P)-dependent dehydrogenase (short-subunit alcohol dehydrogenase family)